MLLTLLCACGRFNFGTESTIADASIDAEPCLPLAGCAGAYAIECGSSCYTVCPETADQPTQGARCQAAGLHLAVILDATTNACISQALAATPGATFWLGLVQAPTATTPTEGWSWVTSDALGYADWLDPDPNPPPNPDDYDGVEDGFEQCVWKSVTRRWEDATCDNITPGVICER